MKDRQTFDSLEDYFAHLKEQLTEKEQTDQLCQDIHDKAHQKSNEDDEHDES